MTTVIPLAKRSCGGCTACCKVISIEEPVRKVSSVWCKDCDIGHGCRIYQFRPVVCKEWACEWLLGLGASDMRPDFAKIIFKHEEKDKDLGVPVMQVYEIREKELEISALVEDIIYQASRTDVRLALMFIPLNRARRIFFPQERMNDEVGAKLKALENKGCSVSLLAAPFQARPLKIVVGAG